MLLQNKNAVIYGAGGSLGGAVAQAFAREGATVWLTGRRTESIQNVAGAIRAAGGKAEMAVVDGFDEAAINRHLDTVRQKAGSVDISFNAVGIDVIQNLPLTDIPVEEIVGTVTSTLQTRLKTAIAAARVMKQQGSGVILFLTATPGGIGYPFTGGFAPACGAVESISRNLASELGVYGIRVVTIRSGGSPDSAVFRQALEKAPEQMASILRGLEMDTMLKKLPRMEDIANTAIFLASGMAGSITGVTVDVTAGTTAALNYRVLSAEAHQATFRAERTDKS